MIRRNTRIFYRRVTSVALETVAPIVEIVRICRVTSSLHGIFLLLTYGKALVTVYLITTS